MVGFSGRDAPRLGESAVSAPKSTAMRPFAVHSSTCYGRSLPPRQVKSPLHFLHVCLREPLSTPVVRILCASALVRYRDHAWVRNWFPSESGGRAGVMPVSRDSVSSRDLVLLCPKVRSKAACVQLPGMIGGVLEGGRWSFRGSVA